MDEGFSALASARLPRPWDGDGRVFTLKPLSLTLILH